MLGFGGRVRVGSSVRSRLRMFERDRGGEKQLLVGYPSRPNVITTMSGFLFRRSTGVVRSDRCSAGPGKKAFFVQVRFRYPNLRSGRRSLGDRFGRVTRAFSVR